MAANSLGNLFKITTFGESHGPAIGVVIDGCPAQLPLNEEDIQKELDLRAPGKSPLTSPRQEKDIAQILSGVFEGQTTGAPIAIVVYNKDADSSKYEPIKHLYRPGHANFTYLQKYGVFDYRGGGRSSARETVARVAAGAVAKKLLAHYKIQPIAYIYSIGDVKMGDVDQEHWKQRLCTSPVRCPDLAASGKMTQLITKAQEEGDSIGGVVGVSVDALPVGLGEPIYEKLEAKLAQAMMSLPASKGIEFGAGFQAAHMRGSEHNDLFVAQEKQIITKTNYSGGVLGGISTGMPLIFRVAFKPTSSVMKVQPTVSIEGDQEIFQLPEGSRHDPCVAIRAVPIVEAMTALVLADAILLHRCSTL